MIVQVGCCLQEISRDVGGRVTRIAAFSSNERRCYGFIVSLLKYRYLFNGGMDR